MVLQPVVDDIIEDGDSFHHVSLLLIPLWLWTMGEILLVLVTLLVTFVPLLCCFRYMILDSFGMTHNRSGF